MAFMSIKYLSALNPNHFGLPRNSKHPCVSLQFFGSHRQSRRGIFNRGHFSRKVSSFKITCNTSGLLHIWSEMKSFTLASLSARCFFLSFQFQFAWTTSIPSSLLQAAYREVHINSTFPANFQPTHNDTPYLQLPAE